MTAPRTGVDVVIVHSPRPEIEPPARTYYGWRDTHAGCALTDDEVRALVGLVIDAGRGAESPFDTMRRLTSAPGAKGAV